MLAGLIGIALPIIAHLISKKKFDVVQWGAMQFLELGKRTRRRIRLEELLLLLVRIGLVTLLVIAFSRPWAKGGVFANFLSNNNRDIVIVLDGSYSMGWEGRAKTPWELAIQQVHDVLEELKPGDKVALIDARSQPRWVIDPPTHDFRQVREELGKLPSPSGSADLPAAIGDGIEILSRTTNLQREVIVITDGQAHGWSAENSLSWQRVDDLRTQPSVKPSIRCFRVGEKVEDRTNFMVEPIQLSRQTTVPEFPIRISTKIKQLGGSGPVLRKVFFEIDGQRRSDKTLQIRLLPDGEATVEFQHRFLKPGSHVVSVILENDPLPGDNRSDAVVVVQQAIPVLVVDGDPNPDETLSESHYLKIGLALSLKDEPWFSVKTVSWLELETRKFDPFEVIILANVPRINSEVANRIQNFVAAGNGLVIAPGDRVEPSGYSEFLKSKEPFLPAQFEKTATPVQGSKKEDSKTQFESVRIAADSLKADWLSRFHDKRAVDLLSVRMTNWWKLKSVTKKAQDENEGQQVSSVILGRLNNGDTFLVQQNFGEGRVLMLNQPLDADWSTMPAKNDFLPFLHEMLFSLTGWRTDRNVDSGSQLVFTVPKETTPNNWNFVDPEGKFIAANSVPTKGLNTNDEKGDQPLGYSLVVNKTTLPGLYRCQRKTGKEEESSAEEQRIYKSAEDALFVVNFDRNESNLMPLNALDETTLAADGRIDFLNDMEELKVQFAGKDSGTELWRWLLFGFLGFLLLELYMTNKLVRGGHEVTDGNDLDLVVGSAE